MKRAFTFVILCILSATWCTAQTAPSCATDQYRLRYRQQYPQFEQQALDIEKATRAWITNYPDHLQTRSLITIPVVVHVVYREEPQNISQEQILSQLEVLNADYRATNTNQDIIPPLFQGLVADLEIEFCLATRDPQGNFTTGITRTQTPIDNIGLDAEVHYSDSGGMDAWDPLHYLNIWVADMGDNVVGRATFPGQAPLAEDGVVIDPRYFGTLGLAAGSDPYHLGRTTVHEVGHYFNLFHPWGTGLPSCDGDDEVEDTPTTSNNYLQECPSSLQASCGSLDMYTNFMYYTNDACLAQFTPGQKLRVLATLNGARAGLKESQGCEPSGVEMGGSEAFELLIYPNPTQGQVVLEVRGNVGGTGQLSLHDPIGRIVWEEKIPTQREITIYPFEALPDGVYFAVFRLDDDVVTRKLIILR